MKKIKTLKLFTSKAFLKCFFKLSIICAALSSEISIALKQSPSAFLVAHFLIAWLAVYFYKQFLDEENINKYRLIFMAIAFYIVWPFVPLSYIYSLNIKSPSQELWIGLTLLSATIFLVIKKVQNIDHQ